MFRLRSDSLSLFKELYITFLISWNQYLGTSYSWIEMIFSFFQINPNFRQFQFFRYYGTWINFHISDIFHVDLFCFQYIPMMSPWLAMIVVNVRWFCLVSLPLWQVFLVGLSKGSCIPKIKDFYFRIFDFWVTYRIWGFQIPGSGILGCGILGFRILGS